MGPVFSVADRREQRRALPQCGRWYPYCPVARIGPFLILPTRSHGPCARFFNEALNRTRWLAYAASAQIDRHIRASRSKGIREL
jgi:hypothetical protein